MTTEEARKAARQKAFQIVEKTPHTTLAMVNAIAAALLAAAAQQREEDARWHDERAKNTPDAFEMELHQKSAAAIRGQKP